jgi:hypothetical protein
MVSLFKKASKTDYIFALGLSYTIGTLLFTYEPNNRMYLGFLLTFIAILSYKFLDTSKLSTNIYTQNHLILTMSFWVFLDSALFESLSRDSVISIWRDGYTFEIVFFHLVGVITRVFVPSNRYMTNLIIFAGFFISYLLYFTNYPLLLSIIYPFIISYYNTVIIQNLSPIKDIKSLGKIMVFVGWIASGIGLGMALEGLLNIVFIIILIILLIVISSFYRYNKKNKKRSFNV